MQYAAGATHVRVRKIICGQDDRLAYFRTRRRKIFVQLSTYQLQWQLATRAEPIPPSQKVTAFTIHAPSMRLPAPPSLSFAGDSLARPTGHPTRDVLHAKQKKMVDERLAVGGVST